jgi:hypothetical protein
MSRIIPFVSLLLLQHPAHSWGFYAHQKINYYAVFLLPPEMIGFYKKNIQFITDHAVDPDMRRYAVAEEGARHYIDIDHYGQYPYDSLPRSWMDAVTKYGEDSLNRYGIAPWWIGIMHKRLTTAFAEKDHPKILKLSAEIGHYLGDIHVPLHACKNHNGQLTGQLGIHAFWESRLPELLAETEWDMLIGKAVYLSSPSSFTWKRVMESAVAADSVLRFERELSDKFSSDRKYSFEERKGKIIRQYSSAYSRQYDQMLNGMPERRMRQSIFGIASFWYTAWVDAGQPALDTSAEIQFSAADLLEFEKLSLAWKNESIKGRDH